MEQNTVEQLSGETPINNPTSPDTGDKRLTAKSRKKLKSKSFALPGRRYPIHDPSHARNALARVAQHGTPEEKKKVRAAVARKYPGISQRGKKRKSRK